MSLPQETPRFTPDGYYRLEREASQKHEYYQGQIFAMSGGTPEHSAIILNIGSELRNRLKGKPCRAYDSGLRLKVLSTGLRTYPDVSVYCGELRRDEEDPYASTFTNPTVVFEVLSHSTEAYDRGFKAENYRSIDTLQAYVLVSQESPRVEIYERQSDGSWRFREIGGLDASLLIASIGTELPLAEIYDGVSFPPPSSLPRMGESR